MLSYNECQVQMENKINSTYQFSKGHKAINKSLWLQQTSKNDYPNEKTWNSGEPSQEWPVSKDYSKSTRMTHLGVHKRTQN